MLVIVNKHVAETSERVATTSDRVPRRLPVLGGQQLLCCLGTFCLLAQSWGEWDFLEKVTNSDTLVKWPLPQRYPISKWSISGISCLLLLPCLRPGPSLRGESPASLTFPLSPVSVSSGCYNRIP